MKLNKELIYRFDDGVIFDTTRGTLHEMNETANEIVQLIDNDGEYDNIINILVKKYDMSSREEIIEFIDWTIDSLKEKGIINE